MSWFSSSSSSAKKNAAPVPPPPPPPAPLTPQVAIPLDNLQQPLQEWICGCDHCLSLISKLPLKEKEKDRETTTAAKTSTKEKDAKGEKPLWSAAVKLMNGQSPVGYSRFPFLELYAENVLNLQKHQVLRLRIQDIKTIFQRRKIIVPELFDYPDSEYVGPRSSSSSSSPLQASQPLPPSSVPVSTASPVPPPVIAPVPVLDVDALVAKLQAVLQKPKHKKKSKRDKHHRRFMRDEQEEEEQEQQEENGEEEEPEPQEAGDDASERPKKHRQQDREQDREQEHEEEEEVAGREGKRAHGKKKKRLTRAAGGEHQRH